VSCIFARQFWFNIFQKRGLTALSTGIEESSFEAWWSSSAARLNRGIQKGFNSLVSLGAWCIWRHCNECVFEGVVSKGTLTLIQRMTLRVGAIFVYFSHSTQMPYPSKGWRHIFIALEAALPHLLTHTTQQDCPLDAKETTEDSQKATAVL
jgi:hypothetical protein